MVAAKLPTRKPRKSSVRLPVSRRKVQTKRPRILRPAKRLR